ncbi:MAG: DUF5791 family protein [Haloferacaceae archaeon]
MLYHVVDDPASLSPDELRERYERRIAETVEAVGVAEAAAESGVDEETVAALVAGESPELTLREAAELLALSPDVRDAETVVLETRDDLLLGMTTGVVDVDTLASNIDHDLTGQEVQQALEGRTRLTLAQLAAIHRFVASRN